MGLGGQPVMRLARAAATFPQPLDKARAPPPLPGAACLGGLKCAYVHTFFPRLSILGILLVRQL